MQRSNNNNNNNSNNASTGTHPACASCKHQRKKCGDGCILAPYFPADKAREFQAVHKLFGVSNISKIVSNLPKQQRKLAVDSLIWEALCWQNDPILGSLGEFKRSEERRKRLEEQLILYQSQVQLLNQNINHKQLMQLPSQGGCGDVVGGGGGGGVGMIQKSVPAGLIVWNGTNDMNNNNGVSVAVNNNNNNNNMVHNSMVNYGTFDDGDMGFDTNLYRYPFHYQAPHPPEKAKQVPKQNNLQNYVQAPILEKAKQKQEKDVLQQQQQHQHHVVTDFDQDQYDHEQFFPGELVR